VRGFIALTGDSIARRGAGEPLRGTAAYNFKEALRALLATTGISTRPQVM